jgi:hypothetical protein
MFVVVESSVPAETQLAADFSVLLYNPIEVE